MIFLFFCTGFLLLGGHPLKPIHGKSPTADELLWGQLHGMQLQKIQSFLQGNLIVSQLGINMNWQIDGRKEK